MAITTTEAEISVIRRILTATKQALTTGLGGYQTIAPVMEAFPPATMTAPEGVVAENGVLLYAAGTVVALEDGILLRSPNGSLYKLTVSNAGAAVFTAV